MLELISAGSPWTLIVLALLGVSLVFSFVATVVSIFRGKLIPLWLWLIIPAAMAFLTFTGTWVYTGELVDSEDLRQMWRATSMSLSLELLAYLCATFCLLVSASAVSFSSLVGTKSTRANRKPTPIAAGLSVIFAVISLVGIGVYSGLVTGGTASSFLKPILMWTIASCVVVNSLREVEDTSHAHRRFHVAVLSALGLISYAGFSLALGEIELFQALEKATPENRLPLIGHGLEYAKEDWNGALLGVGGVVFFGLLPALLHVPELRNRRAALDFGPALVAMILTTIGLLSLNGLTNARHDVRIPQKALSLRASIKSLSMEELELPEQIQHLWLDHVPAGDCVIHRQNDMWHLTSGFQARDACAVGNCESGPVKELCAGLESPMVLTPGSAGALDLASQPWLNGRTIVLGLDQHLKISPAEIPKRYLHYAAPPEGIEFSFHQGRPPSGARIISGEDTGFTYTSAEKSASDLDQDGLFKVLSTQKVVIVPAENWTIKDLAEACIIWNGKVYMEGPQPLSCEVWMSMP